MLAKWLATDPKVLILDGPTVGVDIRNKQGIYDVVRRLAERGVAILLISDEVPEVYFKWIGFCICAAAGLSRNLSLAR